MDEVTVETIKKYLGSMIPNDDDTSGEIVAGNKSYFALHYTTLVA